MYPPRLFHGFHGVRYKIIHIRKSIIIPLQAQHVTPRGIQDNSTSGLFQRPAQILLLKRKECDPASFVNSYIFFFSTANPHFFHGFFFCPIIHYLVKIAMSSFDNSLPCFSQFFYNIIVKLCSGYSFFPHCDCSEHDFFHLPAAVFHGHNCHGHVSTKAASAAASRVQPQPSVKFLCKILMTVSKNHHLGIP